VEPTRRRGGLTVAAATPLATVATLAAVDAALDRISIVAPATVS
jgi:hypothetical protein